MRLCAVAQTLTGCAAILLGMKLLRMDDAAPPTRPARLHNPSAPMPCRPTTPPDASLDDWSLLLQAVRDQLHRSVSAPAGSAADLQRQAAVCVSALDRLQAAWQRQLDLHRQLEDELLQARASLASTRTQWQGAQAGERLARHLVHHDPLTTLPNRIGFRQQLDRALSAAQPPGQPLALMHIDLDDFQPINDQHGQGVGDAVLRIVALRLTHALRARDTVSRLGGDQFGCLVSGLQDRQQLTRLACKVFDAVAAPLSVGDLRVHVLHSIGIALYPAHGQDSEKLLHSADAAMGHAKHCRSGYAFCQDESRAGA